MPEGITSALQSLGNSGILQLAQLGSTGYNIYDQYKNQQYQNTLREDAQNPAKVTALAQQYTQPLNAGLTAAVNNSTQAQLAQSGLSESPQIAQTVEAQAIAPLIQQNQQQGYQNAIQALSLGGGAIPPQLQGMNNLSALAKAFASLKAPGSLPPPASFNPPMLYQPPPGSDVTNPIDTSSWPGQAPPDLSSFYTPEYTPDYTGDLAASS